MNITGLEKINTHNLKARREADRLEQALWSALQDVCLDDVAGNFLLGVNENKDVDRDRQIREVIATNDRFIGDRTLRWQRRTAQRVKTGALRDDFLVALCVGTNAVITLRQCLTSAGDAIEEVEPIVPGPWTLRVHEVDGTRPIDYAKLVSLIPVNLAPEEARHADYLRPQLASIPAEHPGLIVLTDEVPVCIRIMVAAFQRWPLP